MELIKKSNKGLIVPILLLIIGFSFCFLKLGDRKLWLDECISAYLADNVIQVGYPSAFNGEYLKSTSNGNDTNESGVEAWYSWLTIYVQALFRYLFGTSEFVTRLPTAILGWLSFLYLFLGVKKLTANKFVQNLTLATYIFCVPVLIYLRSAHYYASGLAFVTISFYYFLCLIENPDKKKNVILFSVSLILLFHGNYYVFITPAISYLIYAVIKIRDKQTWIKIIITYFIAFIFTTPWLIYILYTTYGTKAGIFIGHTTWNDQIIKLFTYLAKFQYHITPIIILFIVYLTILIICKIFKFEVKSTLKNNSIILPIIIIITGLIVQALLEPFAQTRRILAVIPSLFIISSFLTYKIYSQSKILGYILIPLLLFTNVINIIPWKILKSVNYPINNSIWVQSPNTLQTIMKDNAFAFSMNECEIASPIFKFYEELTTKYTSRTDVIIDYLQKYSKPGETVIAATIDAPKIYYYTKLKIVKQLDKNGSIWGPLGSYYFSGFPNVIRGQKYDYVPDEEIDWIITQELVPFVYDDPLYIEKNKERYESISLETINIFIDNTSEMEYHTFKSPTPCYNIEILKRIK